MSRDNSGGGLLNGVADATSGIVDGIADAIGGVADAIGYRDFHHTLPGDEQSTLCESLLGGSDSLLERRLMQCDIGWR